MRKLVFFSLLALLFSCQNQETAEYASLFSNNNFPESNNIRILSVKVDASVPHKPAQIKTYIAIRNITYHKEVEGSFTCTDNRIMHTIFPATQSRYIRGLDNNWEEWEMSTAAPEYNSVIDSCNSYVITASVKMQEQLYKAKPFFYDRQNNPMIKVISSSIEKGRFNIFNYEPPKINFSLYVYNFTRSKDIILQMTCIEDCLLKNQTIEVRRGIKLQNLENEYEEWRIDILAQDPRYLDVINNCSTFIVKPTVNFDGIIAEGSPEIMNIPKN